MMGNHTTVSIFLLWGFSSFPDLQGLLFVMIFLSHVTILAANVSIMVAIKLSHNLHTPMYFLLSGLSFSETCTTMVIIPRMLVDLLSDSKTISLPECATQMFFFFGFAGNNCFIMAAMSYDRYTAIHNPLHYPILMTHKICLQLMMASSVTGIVVSLCIVLIVFNLSFCDSSIIQHFFCDITPTVSLACDYTLFQKVILLAFTSFVLVGTFILIMISYVFIVLTVVKMPSARGRYKAFSTCSSHLTVVCIHYGFAGFVYLRPKESDSFREDMLMAVTYTVLTPLLNPIVYSLRNKEMQIALGKVLDNVSRFFSHMVSKRAKNTYRVCPDQCGSVGWVLSYKVESCPFYSQSGYMPGWQAQQASPHLGHMRAATDQCFLLALMFLSLSPSPPLSLKIKIKSLKIYRALIKVKRRKWSTSNKN